MSAIIDHRGQEIPLKFNYAVIRQIKNRFGVDLSRVDAESIALIEQSFLNPAFQERLCYEMIVQGYEENNQPVSFQLSDVEELLEESHSEFMEAFYSDAYKFLTPKREQIEDEEEETKKDSPTMCYEYLLSLALSKGLSVTDFLKLSPVELNYFFFMKNETDNIYRLFWEHQIRLINVFTHNSNPYLKRSGRIKEPAKLYAISSEVIERKKTEKKNKEFLKMSKQEADNLKNWLGNLKPVKTASQGELIKHLKP